MGSNQRVTLAVLLFLAWIGGSVAAQEQWQIDQAAGKYWYVGSRDIYSHDPKENNPGTIKVIPDEDAGIAIEIHPDLFFDTSEDMRVRYAFNDDVIDANTEYEEWDVRGIGFLGITYVVASSAFVDRFMDEATREGFVDVELTTEDGYPTYRRFIFSGFVPAFNELADELGAEPLTASVSQASSSPTTPLRAQAPTKEFMGWTIQRGRISKTLTSGGTELKIVVVGDSGDDEPEIRLYPDAEFTLNGETRVRYAFYREPGEMDDYELWTTVIESGRNGYIVFPIKETNDYYSFESDDPLTIDLVDRNDLEVRRTFDIENLKPAFDEMRRIYPELAMGWRKDFMVDFRVSPPDATVTLEFSWLLSWVGAGELDGTANLVDLEQGSYRYTATLPGHLTVHGEFQVPRDTSVEIALTSLASDDARAVASEVVSPSTIGEDEWPLRIDAATLACEQSNMAILRDGGNSYALNRAAEDIYPSVEAILERGRDLEDVTVLSDLALTLCSN